MTGADPNSRVRLITLVVITAVLVGLVAFQLWSMPGVGKKIPISESRKPLRIGRPSDSSAAFGDRRHAHDHRPDARHKYRGRTN